MHNKITRRTFCSMLLALPFPAQAQQPGKIRWIGYLAGGGSSPHPAFVQGMRDLGYVEGKNIGFVYRTAEGRRERVDDLAGELVRLKVDVIVTDYTGGARALKKATSIIPIVMTSSTDPVGTGLVASYARPGGNVTGLTNVGGELGGKVVELLKETAPGVTKAAILASPSPVNAIFLKDAEISARTLAVKLVSTEIQGPDDIEGGFRAMAKEKVNGLVMRLQPSLYSSYYNRVAELTMKNRLPSIATNSRWPVAGGLMSYGSDQSAQYRRAAVYVDKILKGAKPEDLPVEAPMKFEFIVNLNAAKAIGLTIPQWTLMKADRVIK